MIWCPVQSLIPTTSLMGDCPQNCLAHVLLQSHFLKHAGFLSFSRNMPVASSLLLIKSIFTAKKSSPVNKGSKMYGEIDLLRGGSVSNWRHTIIAGCAIFCAAFVMLFGGARMPALSSTKFLIYWVYVFQRYAGSE